MTLDALRANQIPNEGSSSSTRDTLKNKQEGCWFGAVPGKEGRERPLSKYGVFKIHLLNMVNNKNLIILVGGLNYYLGGLDGLYTFSNGITTV